MAKAIDLSKLSLAELKTLQNNIDKAIDVAADKSRQDALADAEKAAAKHGFSLNDLVGGKKKRKTRSTTPKYRHPKDPTVTWSGMGRQPAWYKEAIAGGTKPEALAI